MMRMFLRALARLEDHWIGDLIGTASLFGLLYVGLILGQAAGFN